MLGLQTDGMPVDQQIAAAVDWLDAHPGWLLIIDNVDTAEAVREVEERLTKLRPVTC